ncbi:hypothetical protein BC938DRAFT_474395 [Jimgerdemannia flammicorona]|uniref:Uncharacterized protein n=1 Tax=Jimgerdemannia flammicorona TaxID=994334 RepID=A0A433QZI8_9FUNG|nr:hypothetical protein BC938DRAFT_474395 [Jimgerdemannia flammicorona]
MATAKHTSDTYDEPPPPYSPSAFASASAPTTRFVPNTSDYGGFDTLPTAPPLEQAHQALYPPLPAINPYYPTPSHLITDHPRHCIYRRTSSSASSTTLSSTFSHSNDSCCSPFFDPLSWTCAFYLLLIGPLIALFAFIWVLVTSILCIVSLLFPPLAVLIITITLYSYRLLGRFELLTQELACGNASSPSPTSPPVFYVLPPVFPPPPSFPPTDSLVSGLTRFLSHLLTSRFTVRSFIYFLIIKPVLILALFSVAITAVCIALPLALCLLPAACLLCRTMGAVQKDLAFIFLAEVEGEDGGEGGNEERTPLIPGFERVPPV